MSKIAAVRVAPAPNADRPWYAGFHVIWASTFRAKSTVES